MKHPFNGKLQYIMARYSPLYKHPFNGKLQYIMARYTPLYKNEAGSALELTSLEKIMGLKKMKVL